jgi:hypothetical protein
MGVSMVAAARLLPALPPPPTAPMPPTPRVVQQGYAPIGISDHLHDGGMQPRGCLPRCGYDRKLWALNVFQSPSGLNPLQATNPPARSGRNRKFIARLQSRGCRSRRQCLQISDQCRSGTVDRPLEPPCQRDCPDRKHANLWRSLRFHAMRRARGCLPYSVFWLLPGERQRTSTSIAQ